MTVQDGFVLRRAHSSSRKERRHEIGAHSKGATLWFLPASVPLTVRTVSWRQGQKQHRCSPLGKMCEPVRVPCMGDGFRGQNEHINLMTMSPSVPCQSYIFLDDRRPAAAGGSHIYRDRPFKGRSSCQRRNTGPTTRVMDVLLHLLVCMTPIGEGPPGKNGEDRPRLSAPLENVLVTAFPA